MTLEEFTAVMRQDLERFEERQRKESSRTPEASAGTDYGEWEYRFLQFLMRECESPAGTTDC